MKSARLRDMYEIPKDKELDELHHVAVPVADIAEAVEWYREKFRCVVQYQDTSWALLAFGNVRLALVLPEQHPAHVCLEQRNAERFGKLNVHRDGTRSIYIHDPAGNAVEILAVDD